MLDLHIVYTPGTFDRLKWFALTIHHFAPQVKLVFVTNGQAAREVNEMRAVARGLDRVEILDYPTDQLLPHGTILQGLFDHHSDQTQSQFAFADSDMAMTAPVWPDIHLAADDAAIFSSGRFIKNDQDKEVIGLGGQATMSPSGRSLPVSYFSIYQRSWVDRMRHDFGVGFERYCRKPQLPPAVMQAAPVQDLATDQAFDTGKLLGLLVSVSGGRVVHQNFDGLVHVGGLSKNHKPEAKSQLQRTHAAIAHYIEAVVDSPADIDQIPPPQLNAEWKIQNVLARARGLATALSTVKSLY